MAEENFYITFGWGWTLRNNYIKIQCSSWDEARDKATKEYGCTYSMLYRQNATSFIEKYNLQEVPFGTPNVRQ